MLVECSYPLSHLSGHTFINIVKIRFLPGLNNVCSKLFTPAMHFNCITNHINSQSESIGRVSIKPKLKLQGQNTQMVPRS